MARKSRFRYKFDDPTKAATYKPKTRLTAGPTYSIKDMKKMHEKQFPNELFTEIEAARYLRISRTTLWRMRSQGNIDFRRANCKLLYSRADLENYLERNKQSAHTACAA
jgi:excisionase family DNA binding protein